MTPVPFRGKTNYPKYVRYVVEKLAATYGVGFDKMEEVIEQNCKRIFTKIQ
jgi:TatD DNase family protein